MNSDDPPSGSPMNSDDPPLGSQTNSDDPPLRSQTNSDKPLRISNYLYCIMQMLNTNNPRELPKNQNRMLNDLSHMQKLQDSDQIELKKIKLN